MAVAGFGTATTLVPRLTAGKGGVGRHLPAIDRSAFLGPYRDRARRRRFQQTMHAALADPGLRDDLGRVTDLFADRPVLTTFGEKNDPFGFQNRIASMFTDHQAVVVEGGNHFPMCDAPELFTDTVRRRHNGRVGATATAAGQPD
jgi:haloalkane dehalogenase